jgi:hypothetical protein
MPTTSEQSCAQGLEIRTGRSGIIGVLVTKTLVIAGELALGERRPVRGAMLRA